MTGFERLEMFPIIGLVAGVAVLATAITLNGSMKPKWKLCPLLS